MPASIGGSAAATSLTRIIIAAMQVLKCQRPLKSAVILAMVWCSVRNSFASTAVSEPGPPFGVAAYFIVRRCTLARKRLMPATPSSCHSRSRSGGAAKSAYMRVASAP